MLVGRQVRTGGAGQSNEEAAVVGAFHPQSVVRPMFRAAGEAKGDSNSDEETAQRPPRLYTGGGGAGEGEGGAEARGLSFHSSHLPLLMLIMGWSWVRKNRRGMGRGRTRR